MHEQAYAGGGADMEANNGAWEEVSKILSEMLEATQDALPENHPLDAATLLSTAIESLCSIKQGIQIVAPKENHQEGNVVLHCITLFSDGLGQGAPNVRGGISIKVSNFLLLDWRRLLVDVAESTLTIIGGSENHWLLVLAGLVVWNKIHSLAAVPISEKHAVVLWAMWQNRDHDNQVEESKVYAAVNKHLRVRGRKRINTSDFEVILSDLQKMRCIERVEGSKWRLIERVRIRYE